MGGLFCCVCLPGFVGLFFFRLFVLPAEEAALSTLAAFEIIGSPKVISRGYKGILE